MRPTKSRTPSVLSWSGLGLTLACMLSLPVAAQTTGKAAWNSYGDRIKASQEVSPLGPDLFGDQVSLSNGGLSFTATDVSVPGNSSLPVALTRRYQVKDWRHRIADGMLKDWDLDLPNVSATLATEWVGQNFSTGVISAARCSAPNRPPLPANFEGLTWQDFWHGVQINIPGVTGGELLRTNGGTTRPTTGGPYGWMTNDQVHVSCLPTIKNGAGAHSNGGEGFLAVAPDGTKYWFDWMARSHEAPLKRGSFITSYTLGNFYWTQELPIHRYALYATRIEDRFGNAVELTYSNAWHQPPRLTSIKDAPGGEGRQITVTYAGDAIASVSDGTRTWSYSYGSTGSGRGTLTGVAQYTPDNPGSNAWSINFAQFTNAEIIYPEVIPSGEWVRNCFMLQDPSNYALAPVGTITHPSGAVGTFTMKLKEHNRSGVPVNCDNIVIPDGHEMNDENDDTPRYPFSYIALTLDSKTVSGPNLATAQWAYSYESDRYDWLVRGATRQRPRCTLSLQENCAKPVCTAYTSECRGESRTTVRGPNNEWVHYAHGNIYGFDEGKLKAVDVGTGSGPTYDAQKKVTNSVRRTTNSYDLSRSAQTTPTNWGSSQQQEGDGFQDAYRRPWLSTVVRQQGVDFSRQATALDGFDRPTTETKASIGGSNTSRTDTTEYHDHLGLWVIGQVARTTAAGIQTSRTEFNALAQPVRQRGMGDVLVQELSYHANGVPHTIRDGNSNTTAATDWYRGIPRLITYADSTTHSAAVNPVGWITQVTDQNGFATNYDYDSVGRLRLIQYPQNDSVAWNNTVLSFAPLGGAELGFPAGTWRQQVNTGNGYRRTYFDAMWRPRLTHEFDAADVAGTSRYNAWTYDHEGRPTFAAYPVAAASSTASLTQGIWTTYDRLGRPTSVAQDSELGTLTTLTEYLSGFQTRTTNPRGKVTTTSFLAWDVPDTSSPVLIDAPEGLRTTIARDPMGRTVSLSRSGTLPGQTESLSRSYVYDGLGRLCKTINPEHGATHYEYDAAGNLIRSSDGDHVNLGLACDSAGVPASEKTIYTYDAMNRLRRQEVPGQTGSVEHTYYPDGLLHTSVALQNDAFVPVTATYSYNRRRQLVFEAQSHTGWGIGHTYDANGFRTSYWFPDVESIDLAPNALGQPTRAGSYATSVSYFPNGALKQFTYGNGLVHTMTQNARQLPSRARDANGGAAVVDFETAYDPNGNVLAIFDDAQAGLQDRAMTYDGLDRLVTAYAPGLWGSGSFTYDVLENLRTTTLAGTTRTYGYDAQNRLASISFPGGSWPYVHDSRGNITQRGSYLHTFDRANRMRSTIGAEWYAYDAAGRRVLSCNPSACNYQMYGQSGSLMFEVDHRKNERRSHVHLGDRLIAIKKSQVDGSNPQVFYQHTDALGSPVATTNQAGTVIDRTSYEPYGKAIGETLDGVGYTGHVMDPVSGLVYMQQRYYDPLSGRFLSVDPVSTDPSTGFNFNRYWYGNNNPYKFVDPDGRFGQCKVSGAFCEMYKRAGHGCEMTCINRGAGNGRSGGRRGRGEIRTTEEAVHHSQSVGLRNEISRMEPTRTPQSFAGPTGAPTYNRVTTEALGRELSGIRAERVSILQRIIQQDGSLNTSQTVAGQLSGQRSYIPSLSIVETVRSGRRVPDPKGVAGQSMYSSGVSHNGSRGTLEVLVHEPSGQIRHVLYRSE